MIVNIYQSVEEVVEKYSTTLHPNLLLVANGDEREKCDDCDRQFSHT